MDYLVKKASRESPEIERKYDGSHIKAVLHKKNRKRILTTSVSSMQSHIQYAKSTCERFMNNNGSCQFLFSNKTRAQTPA